MNSTHKKIVVALIIVIFVGAFIYWGTGFVYDMARGRSSEEREILINQIENNRKILENRTEIDYSLEQQVKDVEYELYLQLEELPGDVDIPDLVNEMLDLANDNAVTIIPLRTTSWSSAEREGYQVYRFQVEINGDIVNITGFITDLENSYASSAVVAGLQLTGETIGNANQPSPAKGTLMVSVYRRS